MSPPRGAILSSLPHNRKVITINEPQIWTALGVLAAALASMITITMTSFNRTMQNLGARMDAKFDAVDAKLASLREVMDVRFASVERHLDGLDSDVAALIKRQLDE